MFNKSVLPVLLFGLMLFDPATTTGAEKRTFRVGFFESGPYQTHADFRNTFRAQLQAMLPAEIEINYPADGFLSADWNRAKAKQMARDVTASKNIDLIVATGPWTVEDLLEAGFDRPIVAAVRFDPTAEGLVDAKGRPIVDNLTVRVRPGKLESDLLYLAELARPDTVGVLYFPSGEEAPKALDSMRVLGRRLGFEIVTAEGYDTDGAYAYFKAYKQLSRSADAIYLLPLWGCEGEKIRSFYQMLERDRKLAFSSEGGYHVARGAAASGSAEPALVEAHLQAWKAVRIMQGMVAADLPTELADSRDLTLNDQVLRSLGRAIPFGRRYDLTVIDGPAADSVERLTVVDAVGLALSQNPGFQATYQTLDAAERAASEARSAYLPQLELNGSAAYFDDNAVNNDSRYDNRRLGAHLSLRQELFALGAIKDIRTAALQRDQSRIDQKQASLDLELAVTLAYLDMVAAEQMRLIEQTHRRQAGECLQLARLRLALNEAPAVDVWRAEQGLMYALQDGRTVECQRQVARVLLNTLLGRPANYPFVVDWQHFSDARFHSEESLIEQLTRTPEQRAKIMAVFDDLAASGSPEAQGSDIEIAVRKSQLSRANSSYWPRIGFFADLGLTDELAKREGFDEANPSWSIGADIKLPLFLGGRRTQERRRMQALLDRETYRKDQVALETRARVRVALESAFACAEAFMPAARAAELAGQICPEVMARYSYGTDRMTDLLTVLRDCRDADRDALVTQIDYYRAAADAVRAAGISPYESGKSASEELMNRLASSVSAPAR